MSSSPSVPHRYAVTHRCLDIVQKHEGLGPGGRTGDVVRVAGRLLRRRPQGELYFADLHDQGGSVQLLAARESCGDFDSLVRRGHGDWVGVEGEVVASRRGELSVEVRSWTLLAAAQLDIPDGRRGFNDVERRFRERYVDFWATPGARQAIELRSKMTSAIRARLVDRGFLEIETPMLHPIPGGANARPFVTHHMALDTDLFLRIAPELYLKRLVVGGFDSVFEIGRVFRNEGMSTRHNPEFTILELYQAYADYGDMMDITEEIVSGVTEELCGSTSLTYDGRPLDLAAPWRRVSMVDLVQEVTGHEVDLTDQHRMAAVARKLEVDVDPESSPGVILFEIYERRVEDTLWDPVFVCDHPVETSPLARRHRRIPGLTERFEAVVAGRELANAFSELNDPDDQLERFQEQAGLGAAGDDEAMKVDLDYVRALRCGLPPTGGLGIGIDRLAMLITGASSIREVLAFPTMRPEQPS